MPPAESIEQIRRLTSPLTSRPTGEAPRIEPLAGIRAVLFDVYGTLVISGCGDIGLTAPRAEHDQFRRAVGAAGIGIDALPDDFNGTRALVEAIAESHANAREQGVDYPEVDILAIWETVLEGLGIRTDAETLRRVVIEYEFRSNPVWPMPGLDQLLDALTRRDLVLGIVSNAQFYTPLMLAAFLGSDIGTIGFDQRCCAWSYQHRVGKPSVRVFEPALAALARDYAIEPQEVLYIGNDLRNDIWPAKQLGCRTALFAGDARSLRLREDDPSLRDVHPDRVVTALEQITTHLLAG
ncbi:MAG: HAD family hydrolase [Thiohalocapsa sp.]